MTVVILTGHPENRYAGDVLRAINGRGVRKVHVVAGTWKSGPRNLPGLLRTHGPSLPWVVAKWLARGAVRPLASFFSRRCPATGLAADVERQGGRFVLVEDPNGTECGQILGQLGVDILVLAGAPIVRANILGIPRIGTLNAHQGALPKYRGMNVVEWAIFDGSVPSVSVHFVDPGIDTGDVVATEEIEVRPTDTIEGVRARAATTQAHLLAWAVGVACSRPLPRLPQRAAEGRQYYVMHPRLRRVTQRRLAGVSDPARASTTRR